MSVENELTLREMDLLEPCANALWELELGKRHPHTALRKHFVDVCKKRAEPSTEHEVAYLKWRRLGRPDLGKLRRRLIAQSKCDQELKKITEQAKARDAAERGRQCLTESFKRYIDEPLGTREDFKKDRASWKSTHT